ncbi:glutathione S-transferase, unnamed subgroup 2 [Piscinibacter sakaiensis]|uniref:Glutathione S-transferase, unnamed subgroup 2 n=2 Tax=Piscinibacter sakaiensis TaxID=1547922 RepID=A0A0K8NY59_PISS1|nr:glutathione S-transferase, unnamed subgroup 2 [Piscinibacter sakaiensis]
MLRWRGALEVANDAAHATRSAPAAVRWQPRRFHLPAMQLIGMLDSPYVRRVAITLQLLGLPFEHRSVSVFRGFDAFHALNPVVKAPTLVCDDGLPLMDSTLIIDYAEALAGRSLMPAEPAARLRVLRRIGLALAACEKAVQYYYEGALRPPEKAHAPWRDRVTGQLHAAFAALEAALPDAGWSATPEGIGQDGLSTAVAWHFTQQTVPGLVSPQAHPRLVAFSAAAEAMPAFRAAAHGDGTVPVAG